MQPQLRAIPKLAEYPGRQKRVPPLWVAEFESTQKSSAALEALRTDYLVASDGEKYRVHLTTMRQVLGNEYADRFFKGIQVHVIHREVAHLHELIL